VIEISPKIYFKIFLGVLDGPLSEYKLGTSNIGFGLGNQILKSQVSVV